MYPEDQEDPADLIVARTWQATLFLGVVTVILGLIVSFRPSGSLNVIAVLLGILMIISGIFHLIRVFDRLIVGLTWIIQGLSALFGGVAGSREGRGWWIFFGIVSLIAGIVVVSAPVSSVTVLAVLLGIWFIVMGLFEVIAAFIIRRAVSAPAPAQRSADEETPTR